MGITNNLKSMASSLQQGAKQTTLSLTQRILRLISGLFLALIFSLIIQEMMQSGSLTLVFLIVLFTTMVYLFLARYSVLQILIFDLICVLIVSLLRLYIMVAP